MNAPDLHVHSGFSTYDGMGSPEGVVDRAVQLGWGAVCLTEHGWLGSAPALYKAAKAAKIKPIIGCELYVTPEEALIDGDKTVLQERRHLTVLALSFEGYQNLVTWVNKSMDRPAYYNGPRISLDRMADIAPYGLHHNAILSGCLGGELCQCLLHGNGNSEDAARLYLDSARSLFPNFYIELQNHLHDKFYDGGLVNYDTMVEQQAQVREQLLAFAQELGIPVIVTNDSHYQEQAQRKSHVAMMARKQARRGRDAHEAQVTLGTSSSFQQQYIYWASYMRSVEKIASSLPSWAEKQSIESIKEIVDEAEISLDPLDKFSYTLPRSAHADPVGEVRRRCKSRLKSMVVRHGEEAQRRFDYELGAMEEFAHYLLIYSDIIRMCRSQGIYTWTRGSAANSLVCYCLKIHEIDPIHYKLMFERFVNPARTKFPDVDIDIEGHRQQDVARMITEYMAEIEGEGNVLPICTYNTTSNRNAFRMMAEAAGIEQEEIDRLAKLLPQMIDSGMVESTEEAYEIIAEDYGIDIYESAKRVFDQVNGVSQHACAFALGTSERPLSSWVPQFRIGSSNAVVTQFNMKWIEELGFLKLDLLKLNSLAIMHDIARLLGKDIKWLDQVAMAAPGIYELDDDTAQMLQEGRTEGVHSMQGGTQRRGCTEVLPESLEDLVAIQALYRPGAGSRTGTDKSFVDRRHGREDWASINEFVGGYLDETYGYSIFQEQIMEMAFGMGMSGAEVDDLYKAIKTAKGAGRGAKEKFDAFEPTFRQYADKMKMPKREQDELWALWYTMQGYAFNRGHASSYAILAAKMAWLKQHYPQEFYIALLGRYPANARYLAASIYDGFTFEPPDVNTSSRGFSRGSTDKSIRVGLVKINGIGDGAAQAIVRNQPFASVEDLIERVGTRFIKQGEKVNTLEILASVGALDSLGIKADDDDAVQFERLNFVLHKPAAFEDCKPSLASRKGGAWQFLGLQRGVQINEGKTFVAKMFWVPKNPAFTTKTSVTGKYNAHLLTVVDENGIPFDLIVAEDKEHESNIVKALAEAEGTVVTCEGRVSMPFLRDGNTGFRLWGIAGAEQSNPQCWHMDKKVAKYIVKQAKAKAAERRR